MPSPKTQISTKKVPAVTPTVGGGMMFGVISENAAFALVFILSVAVAFVAFGPKIEKSAPGATAAPEMVDSSSSAVVEDDTEVATTIKTDEVPSKMEAKAEPIRDVSAAPMKTLLNNEAVTIGTHHPTDASVLFQVDDDDNDNDSKKKEAQDMEEVFMQFKVGEVCKSLRTLGITLEGNSPSAPLPAVAPRPAAAVVAQDGSDDSDDEDDDDAAESNNNGKKKEEAVGLVSTIVNKHRWIFVRELLGRADGPAPEGTHVEDTEEYHDALIALQIIIEQRRFLKKERGERAASKFSEVLGAIRPPKTIFDLPAARAALLPPSLKRLYDEAMYRVNCTIRVLRGLHAFVDDLHQPHLLGEKQVSFEEARSAVRLIFMRPITTANDDRVFCAPLLLIGHTSFHPTATLELAGTTGEDRDTITLKRARISAGPISANMLKSYPAQEQLAFGGAGVATHLNHLHRGRQRNDATSDPSWQVQWFSLQYRMSPSAEALQENCLDLPLVIGGDGRMHPLSVKCFVINQLSSTNRPRFVDFLKTTDVELLLELTDNRRKWITTLIKNYTWAQEQDNNGDDASGPTFVSTIVDDKTTNPTYKLERQLQVLGDAMLTALQKATVLFDKESAFYTTQKKESLREELHIEATWGQVASPLERAMRDSSRSADQQYGCDKGFCGGSNGVDSPLSDKTIERHD